MYEFYLIDICMIDIFLRLYTNCILYYIKYKSNLIFILYILK